MPADSGRESRRVTPPMGAGTGITTARGAPRSSGSMARTGPRAGSPPISRGGVARVEAVCDVWPHGVLYRAPSLLRRRTAGAAGSGPDAEHRDGPAESDRDGTH